VGWPTVNVGVALEAPRLAEEKQLGQELTLGAFKE